MSIFAIRTTSDHSDIGERSVMIVAEEDARLRVDCNIYVRPAIVIEIVRGRADRISWARFEYSRLRGNIGECPITIVVIQDVRVAGESSRPAHHRDAFPL